MNNHQPIDLDKVAQAIEADAGMTLPDLREALKQARQGMGRVTTPAQIAARRGRPAGSVQTSTKRPTTLRLDEDALARWRASGKGWQTRAAALLAANAP